MKQFLTLFFFIVLAGGVQGQPYYFKSFQVESGLSNNSVICTMQDKKGFLWFGTKDGLNRFDGYQFRVFRNIPGDTRSLGGNFIHALHEDRGGRIWVGTDRGLYLFDQVSETFSRITAAPADEVREIKTDLDNNVWFIDRLTLYRYDPDTRHCVVYPPDQYFRASSLCISGDNIWIASTKGDLYRHHLKNNTFSRSPLFNTDDPISLKSILRIYDADNGCLLVSTAKQGVKLFDTRTRNYKNLPMTNEDGSPIFARDILQSGKDEFWFATESGIFIYQLETGKFIRLKKQYNDPFSLSDNAIYALCHDREGGIWAGTYFGGVNHYAKYYATFEKYFPRVEGNSISGNAVREIQQDAEGNIWIGTEDGGLNKLNGKGEFTNYRASNTPGAISTNNIHGLLITGDTVWIGTFENGLDLLRISTGRVVKHYDMSDISSGLTSNFIYQIFRAKNGTIWLATGHGVLAYNQAKERFEPIEALPDHFYNELYEDSEHNIWAGTYHNGVYWYNTITKTSGRLKGRNNNTDILVNERINAIHEDRYHNLWFGTERGLFKFEKNKLHIERYDIQTGFPSDVIYAILPDRYERLWISTSKGLVCLNIKTNNFQLFTTADGLLSNQFNYRSFAEDNSGRLYFGSVKGLIRFYPFLNDQKYTSPNYITGFQINNQDVGLHTPHSPLKKSILLTDTILLDYSQSSFSIDFASLSYTSAQKTHYRYRMEGLNNDWTSLTKNMRVYFTHVSPGTYNFRFKSSNYTGVWSAPSKTLTIIITPPFWADKRAYVLYFTIAGLLIYFGFRSYLRRLNNRHQQKIATLKVQQEKEVYESKISFFTNVAHEIRTPLSLIIAPMERVIRASENVPAIHGNLTIMEKNAKHLLELTNQLLDFRKTEANGYDLSFVRTDVRELLNSVVIRFSDLAFERNLDYRLLLSDHGFIAYVDREIFAKIISNLIDNAVKYAKSKIYIQLQPPGDNDEIFIVQVKSDGPLIPKDKSLEIFEAFHRLHDTQRAVGSGLGLSLSRSLAELHRGKLTLLSPEDHMNIFQLSLPVHQEIEFDVKVKIS